MIKLVIKVKNYIFLIDWFIILLLIIIRMVNLEECYLMLLDKEIF